MSENKNLVFKLTEVPQALSALDNAAKTATRVIGAHTQNPIILKGLPVEYEMRTSKTIKQLQEAYKEMVTTSQNLLKKYGASLTPQGQINFKLNDELTELRANPETTPEAIKAKEAELNALTDDFYAEDKSLQNSNIEVWGTKFKLSDLVQHGISFDSAQDKTNFYNYFVTED